MSGAAFVAVMQKEIRQTMRDRRMMAMLLAAPMVQLIIFGSAVNLEVDRVPTAVVDRDQTSTSREHLRRFLADGTLLLTALGTEPEATGLLENGEVVAVVIIPKGFGRALARSTGAPAEVQVLLDGTNPNQSAVATSAVLRFFRMASVEVIVQRLARLSEGRALTRPPEISVSPRVLYNPRLKTAIYMVPGIASMLLLVVTTIVTSMGLARERETGTLEQILVTPVRPVVLLVAKMAPFALVGLFDFLLAMAVGAWVFDMPIRGSFVLLVGATTLYLITTLAMGLLISTLSTTQQQAFMGGFLFLLPAALLSGIMTPIRSMPNWLQALTLLNPLRHYAEVLRAVLLRDAPFREVVPQLITLAGFGLALTFLASMRFRKTLG